MYFCACKLKLSGNLNRGTRLPVLSQIIPSVTREGFVLKRPLRHRDDGLGKSLALWNQMDAWQVLGPGTMISFSLTPREDGHQTGDGLRDFQSLGAIQPLCFRLRGLLPRTTASASCRPSPATWTSSCHAQLRHLAVMLLRMLHASPCFACIRSQQL